MKFLIIFFISIFFVSCSNQNIQKDVQKTKIKKYKKIYDQEIKKNTNNQNPAVKIIKINQDNFQINNFSNKHSNKVIDKIKIVGASMLDTINLITEATSESIVFQMQSENIETKLNHENNKNSKIFISAEDVSFDNLLDNILGDKFSVKYENGLYLINSVQKVTLKVPPIKEIGENLVKALTSFGAVNIVYDQISSYISFVAKQKDYENIVRYVNNLKDNLYVIEYDVEVYNVELKDEYNIGINWEVVKNNTNFQVFTNMAQATATTNPFQLGVIKETSNTSINSFLNMLEVFGKVESIQKPKLLGLAGTKVMLKDGFEETFIKEITNSMTNNVSQTSTVTESVLTGLEIELNSNVLDDTVIMQVDLKIDDIIGYNEFSVDDTVYKQPKKMVKDIKNTIRVKAGEPVLISGLYKHTKNKNYSGIPNTQDSFMNFLTGQESKSGTKTEMVILVTPRLIKYEMY
jgi:type II secretory pathway component GspD/PulD (secretin)